jgi:hypothetical protein
MVLTAAQTSLFFENAAQMAIPNATVLELVNEGIDTVVDLSERKARMSRKRRRFPRAST